jgi:tRNA wybutosine-synthesizing protein 2
VNFATHSARWHDVYNNLDANQRRGLFASVVRAFSTAGQKVTHIAINAPISALESSGRSSLENENTLRSPTNLTPVYGDFGPSSLLDRAANAPSRLDLDAAFWVSTQQSQNVSQVWAPRWTMFSRGNVSEKKRILGCEDGASHFPGLTEPELGQNLVEVDVVDMYVGVGYFTFSYLARGVGRVWGWDLNPWSIEGLRRGCEANGWRCLIVGVSEDGSLDGLSIEHLGHLLSESEADGENNPIRCVGFRGDNKWAAHTMAGLAKVVGSKPEHRTGPRVRHVNLGLLPTSRAGWEPALSMVDGKLGGWLHVHENVDVRQIEDRLQHIVHEMDGLLVREREGCWRAACQHVERVKTYAPGVMHCVFDIRVQPEIN